MTHQTCGRQNRNNEPCQLPQGWGTNHPGEGPCKFHGGASPQVEEYYERKLREQAQHSLEAALTELERLLKKQRETDEPLSKDEQRFLSKMQKMSLDRIGYGPHEEHDVNVGGQEDGVPVKHFVVDDANYPDQEDDEDGGD